MSGYVHIHRRLLGHHAFRNDAEAMAFAWMVVRASWNDSRVRYKDRILNLSRGQLAISVRDMAAAMDRDKAWIERLWKRLKAETMIETVAEAGVTVITICNYNDYQASRDRGKTERETPDETGARQGRDTEQRREEIYSGSKEPSLGVKRARASRIPVDWKPGPLPPSVAALVVLWPPGRLERELDGFRDYWTARSKDAARLDWDKTWHNRIRDQHDRVMREVQNGQRGQNFRSPADKRDGVARALDRSLGYGPADGYRTGEAGGGGVAPIARFAGM